MHYIGIYKSPLGTIVLTCTKNHLISIDFDENAQQSDAPMPQIFTDCTMQLEEYFAGKRTHFDLPINMDGTSFQKEVWTFISTIPHGTTWSYKECTTALGKPSAVRAVANAIASNRLAIVIPCHRIIGSNGTLTGYRHGIPRKKWLIEHEYQKSKKTS